jgi:hypothetical protein
MHEPEGEECQNRDITKGASELHILVQLNGWLSLDLLFLLGSLLFLLILGVLLLLDLFLFGISLELHLLLFLVSKNILQRWHILLESYKDPRCDVANSNRLQRKKLVHNAVLLEQQLFVLVLEKDLALR